MNKILKFALAVGVMAPAFLIAGSALAATNVTQVTLNGGANAVVPLNATVQGVLFFDTTAGSDFESFSHQIIDSSGNAALPPVCVMANPAHTTAGSGFQQSFTIGTASQSEGSNWRIRIRTFGIVGTAANTTCDTSIGGQPTDTFTTPGILTLTSPTDSNVTLGNPFTGNPNAFCTLYPWQCYSGTTGVTGFTGYNNGYGQVGNGYPIQCLQNPVLCGITSPTGSTIPSAMDTLTAKINALTANLTSLTTVVAGLATPAPSTLCTQYAAYSYLHYGMSGAAGLQTFLITHGYSIPAGATGYFGSQTAAAVGAFLAANHC